jgi:hypothetical protein
VTDIQEFLRARYADDRRTAEDAALRGDTVWRVCENSKTLWGSEEPDVEVLAGGKPVMRFNGEYNGPLVAAHVILHSPAAVIADIAAKLRIVGLYTYVSYNDDDEPYFCGSGEETWYETLCLLALPYARHTDYDQRWTL